MGANNSPASGPSENFSVLALNARRTRKRLLSLEGQNPLRARLTEGGDNTPWADSLEELHNDMTNNEFLATREILLQRLRGLSRAAEKVEEGTYGVCDSCGEPIPAGRLQAVPEAACCVACTEAMERQGAKPDRGSEPILVTG